MVKIVLEKDIYNDQLRQFVVVKEMLVMLVMEMLVVLIIILIMVKINNVEIIKNVN